MRIFSASHANTNATFSKLTFFKEAGVGQDCL